MKVFITVLLITATLVPLTGIFITVYYKLYSYAPVWIAILIVAFFANINWIKLLKKS